VLELGDAAQGVVDAHPGLFVFAAEIPPAAWTKGGICGLYQVPRKYLGFKNPEGGRAVGAPRCRRVIHQWLLLIGRARRDLFTL